MRSIRTLTLASALALAAVGAAAQTPDFSPEALHARAVERRAVEAVIWGMPAVNYDLMLQEMIDTTAAKPNQVLYWGRPLDWKNQTLTPNPDTLYFMAFFDTREGPVVMEVPPAREDGSLNGNIVTVWQMPLEDVGRLGVDKGAGGKFVILPPKAMTPDEARAIAKEAYIYGVPMVSMYATMHAFSLDESNPEYKGPFNTVLNIGCPHLVA